MVEKMSAFSKETSTSCVESDPEIIRRGPWTFQEDTLLIQYIARHGEGRWNLLAKRSGLKRTGKSCRLRWLNYLKPDVKRGNFTAQEQISILDLHFQWGNRWSKIAQHLPGRTDNEIKNYWRTRVQKHARRLMIDANSTAFQEIIRCFWLPGLLQNMDGSSSSSSLLSQNSMVSDQGFNNNNHVLHHNPASAQSQVIPCHQGLIIDDQQKLNYSSSVSDHGIIGTTTTTSCISSSSGCSMDFSKISEFPDYPTGAFHANTCSVYNTSSAKDFYQFENNCYNMGTINQHQPETMPPALVMTGDSNSTWVREYDGEDSFSSNMDELWQFRNSWQEHSVFYT